jgi:hypothetical protein
MKFNSGKYRKTIASYSKEHLVDALVREAELRFYNYKKEKIMKFKKGSFLNITTFDNGFLLQGVIENEKGKAKNIDIVTMDIEEIKKFVENFLNEAIK